MHTNLEEASNRRCPVSEDTQQNLETCMKMSSVVVEMMNDEAI
jgi:hypothetical protein